MTGVDYKREPWLVEDVVAVDAALPVQHDVEEQRRDRGLRVAAILCSVLAAVWVGVSVLSLVSRPPVGLAGLAGAIAAACPPLVLIGLAYLIVARTSRRESDRVARVSAMLRAEQARLDAVLAHAAARIADERVSIGEHADQLAMIGEDAAHRLRAIGDGLRRDIDLLARDAGEIATASAQARSDFAVLTDGLPHARAEVDALTMSIDTAGLRSHERAGALDAAVVALAGRVRDVDDVAGGAAQRLSAHLARVEGTSAAATGAIVAATGTMTGALDRTLAYATKAADTVRHVVANQSEAVLAIVAESEAALAKTSADTGAQLRERVDFVIDQMTRLGALLDEQRRAGEAVVGVLGDGIGRVDAQYVAFGDTVRARSAEVDAALSSATEKGDRIAQAFATSGATADHLVERIEALMTAADAATREIDETIPAALSRLDASADTSFSSLERIQPAVEHAAERADEALDRLRQADDLLGRQQAGLAQLGDAGRAELSSASDAARTLLALVERTRHETMEAARTADVGLAGALGAVETGARRAVESARIALESVAPEVADRLGRSVRTALAAQVDEEVSARVEALGQTAERAIAAANQASDRLMRQMLTIAETSAQVEARIADARAEAEDGDRDDFSRRVALLIESLNSTAIDVAKILSNDVGDAAWAAYLKGDRGVFARRAVRLLDTAEVREIARHYGEEPEFREQVNRYIHDFESMLRNVLATRNGSPLGVTLLSSDMGKLYVALAQAIERLRA